MKRLIRKRPKTGKGQEPTEILLLGPDEHARIMLLINMQNVFDSAGKFSRDKAFKDEIIRQRLPTVCGALHEHSDDLANCLTGHDRAHANLSKVYEYTDSFHPDKLHAQTVDALATLWTDEKSRWIMTETFQKSPVEYLEVDR